MSKDDEGSAARLRLRVAGSFSAAPAGRRFTVDATTFLETMAAAGLGCRVVVPDRLGIDATRTFELAFARPRAFSLAEVVAATPVLAALRELAEALGRGDAARVLPPELLVERLGGIVGDGRLAAAVIRALRPGERAPNATPGAASGAEGVDRVFEQADFAPSDARLAVGAVDAFVKSMREPSATARAAAPATGLRAARQAIEEAVYATARDLLGDPRVGQLEGAWRGLKLLVDQCPAATPIAIEVIDTTIVGIDEVLAAELADDSVDRPDLLVVVDPCDDAATLARLAELGERLLAPVVAALSPAFFGASGPDDLLGRVDEPGGGVAEAWTALRGEESARWLSVVVNRAVVASEGSAAARRVAFTSPAFALAAMLAASFRDTRSFARILGAVGALDAPAAWDIATGREAGVSAPTEVFCSLRAQAALAALGVIGVGSGRNTSKLMLSTMPTARASADAVPLAAQIVTGRIVRFAEWVIEQVPAGATDAEAASLFEEAARVFLFAGVTEGATLRAGVGQGAEGRRVVEIAVAVHAALAGIPFQMAFTLPLR